ncbi:putative CAAX prenyl protease 1 [Yarrowia sp. B02]|nr:putative CAAX prenyl protease 1 [Yarrowia sp. B02]
MNHLKKLDSHDIPWRQIVMGGATSEYLLQSYLNYRQYQVYKRTEVPDNLKNIVSQDKFIESNEYSLAKMRFSFVNTTYSLLQGLATIHYNIVPKLFHVTKMVFIKKIGAKLANATFFGAKTLHSLALSTPVHTAVAFNTYAFVGALLELPFSYYQHFVLEKKYGFNKMTVQTFLVDFVKSQAVGFVVQSVLMATLEKILIKFGLSFVPYVTGFIIAFQIFATWAYPAIIMPLFNKFEKLPDGELKTRTEALAKKLDFPLTDIYVMDGSSRTAHSNAFFTGGPWKKQIVLYDNLIEQSTPEQIEAVLAHELGHWKKSHILITVAAANLNLLTLTTGFLAFAHNESFFDSLGFFSNDRPAAYLFSTLYFGVIAPLQCGITFLMNGLSRRNEFEADKFAKDLGYGDALGESLITMQRENLSNYDGDWLYNSYHRSHPLLLERLNAVGYKPKAE